MSMKCNSTAMPCKGYKGEAQTIGMKKCFRIVVTGRCMSEKLL